VIHRRTDGTRAGFSAWPVRSAPPRFLAIAFLIEAVAGGSIVALLVARPSHGHALWVTIFLVAIAILFEEVVARAARLRLRLGADLKQDMVSVWVIAATLALPPSDAVLVVLGVLGYTWFRQERPAGQALYRKLYNVSNSVLSCLLAGMVFRAASVSLDSTPWAIASSCAALAAVVTYTLANRFIVSFGLLVLRRPLRVLLGSRDDNLTEIATLCLGALVALAVTSQPLLAVLVLAPMITLQRGAVIHDLEAAATTDAKTGLLNAVAWEQLAERELGRAAREHTPTAVIIVDVDHFKRINDRFGHLVGDQVLRAMGRVLSAGLREYDTLARFGGEEFVAVLPDAEADVALVVAERLRSRINELWVSQIVDGLLPDADELLAVSIGVSTCRDGATELQQLLYEADGALYRAKELGRNRVVLAGDAGSGSASESPVLAS